MELYSHIKPSLAEIEKIMKQELDKEDQRTYGVLTPYIMRGGKRIRPALTILSCRAVGGNAKDALHPAAIIELFHNFTLIHDDIEDDSRFRRGEPTLHISHGLAMALNSGDALYTFIWKKLLSLDLEPEKLIALQNLYVDSFKRVVDGQGIEISWIREGRFDVSESEYLKMIRGKTSALMGLSCEVGALLGGNNHSKDLRDFGEKIGAAFQIQDDILNLTGDFKKYQKEIGGDISEGKRTLMVVHCLSHANKDDKQKLVSIISKQTKDKKEIEEAISILKKYKSIEYAKKYAVDLANKAKTLISNLPDSKDKNSLIAIADYVIARDK